MLLVDLDTLDGVSTPVIIALFIVCGLIAVVAVIAFIVQIWLAIKYLKFNRKKNSAEITGVDAARQILDDNGLQNIKVSVVGSLLFGNSYSHYFHKVRLRRFTRKKKSISSLAMGSQKAALAVLDKENDPDMRKRIRLIPLQYFGSFMFLPIIIIGALIDFFILKGNGVVTVISAIIGLILLSTSIWYAFLTLKSEKKAQERACEILKEKNMATDEEVSMMKELFHLYNIEYINDIIITILQLIKEVLLIVAKIQQNSSKRS